MRERGRGGDGGRDWGSIDWSNIDLSGFGRGTRVPGPSRRAVLIALFHTSRDLETKRAP